MCHRINIFHNRVGVSMRRSSILALVALCVFTSGAKWTRAEEPSPMRDLFGPKYKPTKGAIWPQPKQQVIENIYYKFSPKHFRNIAVTGETCDILKKAIRRYAFILKKTHKTARILAKDAKTPRSADINHRGFVEQLRVDLTAPCESYPYFGMNESYELVVSRVSQLTSSSVWGILRGLESWLQLFYISDGDPDIRINKTSISDSPRFPHRGLLIDTARHYISLSKIRTTLDAMAMNKMNLLHWHIVDDQSFPYQSSRFPELRILAKDAKTPRSADINHRGFVEQLRVDLTAPCECYPYFGMDESYELVVSRVSQLTSSSVWGILRGLESWLQLFYISDGDPDIRINKTSISDSPRFPHRGLLIDTARHYISLSKIRTTLDAMAMNKMNLLHWHIVDDQSFPYQSSRFPELSQRGAYHRSLIYTQQDVQMIINYARDRGIRVVPEFDVPGHTRSWGESHPEVLTSCYSAGRVVGLGPMNPLRNATYQLLQELVLELQALFPDQYFHVGGDEVNLECWESNPELIAYMREHNMKSADDLHALFMRSMIPLLGSRSTPIVWQEVFDEGVPLPTNTLIQVWKSTNITHVLEAGYDVIYSTGQYLDHLDTGGDWEKYYTAEPQGMREGARGGGRKGLVLGGEACMWAEVVDDRNFLSRIWPRASAVAERLWSPFSKKLNSVPLEVYSRLEEHTCRMIRRGVPAQPPSGAGVCLGATT